MGAGDYRDKFTWLKQSTTQNPNTGQEEESFTSNGTLHCNLTQVSATERTAYGLLGSFVDGKIKLRNRPALSFKDKLQDLSTGEEYLILGITYDRANMETVVTVQKWRE